MPPEGHRASVACAGNRLGKSIMDKCDVKGKGAVKEWATENPRPAWVAIETKLRVADKQIANQEFRNCGKTH